MTRELKMQSTLPVRHHRAKAGGLQRRQAEAPELAAEAGKEGMQSCKNGQVAGNWSRTSVCRHLLLLHESSPQWCGCSVLEAGLWRSVSQVAWKINKYS